MKREASLQLFLHKLKHKNFFNINVHDKLHPSGSATACVYDTTKMQKLASSDSLLKLHPIASFVGTFNYNLACFLCDLPAPLAPDDYSWKYTFTFVSQIMNANLSGKFLVSYDVTSLFTNFPLQETIVIAINLSFNYNPNLNINKKNIKNISFLLHQRPIFFLIINFKIKLME